MKAFILALALLATAGTAIAAQVPYAGDGATYDTGNAGSSGKSEGKGGNDQR